MTVFADWISRNSGLGSPVASARSVCVRLLTPCVPKVSSDVRLWPNVLLTVPANSYVKSRVCGAR